jgi:hypothetical protein
MCIVARSFLQSEQVAQLRLTSHELALTESQLVSKSDGVFLWLTLVIRNLEDGLINGDSFRDLSSRILSLPTELSDLFISLLNSISQHDRSYCFPLLRVMYEVHEDYPLSLLGFWCLDIVFRGEGVEDVVGAIGSLDSDKETVEKRLLKETERLCRRIRGRFCGLIQAPTVSFDALTEKVDFNHRSIQEFLASDRAKRFLGAHFTDHDWYQSICDSLELQSRLLMHPRLDVVIDGLSRSGYVDMHRSELWDNSITNFAIFTGFRFDTIPRAFFDTVDSCDRILSMNPIASTRWDPKVCPNATYYLCLRGSQHDDVSLWCSCRLRIHLSMELCLARASIHEYFKAKLETDKLALRALSPEFLLASVLEVRHRHFLNRDRCVAFFRTLLEGGVHPNSTLRLRVHDSMDKTTLHSLFCLVVKLILLTYFETDRTMLLEIMDCLVKAGLILESGSLTGAIMNFRTTLTSVGTRVS